MFDLTNSIGTFESMFGVCRSAAKRPTSNHKSDFDFRKKMEEEKLQALADSLSGHGGRKGLGISSGQYSWVKTVELSSGKEDRKDGLPNNQLYSNFVKAGTYDPTAKEADGDGRLIKRDFSDGPILPDNERKARKDAKKAAKKKLKMEAKKKLLLEEKRKAKKERKALKKESKKRKHDDKHPPSKTQEAPELKKKRVQKELGLSNTTEDVNEKKETKDKKKKSAKESKEGKKKKKKDKR
ncbi:MAG: hypothetical protein SGBAC_007857 [Bacillariaceae sp.]